MCHVQHLGKDHKTFQLGVIVSIQESVLTDSIFNITEQGKCSCYLIYLVKTQSLSDVNSANVHSLQVQNIMYKVDSLNGIIFAILHLWEPINLNKPQLYQRKN
jgi:hypothetical protein